ncbi:MAG: hypothetical protein IJ067_05545 [Prevotella sp.]|nr:hypothetical protein [Prevotella sp.]
MCWKEPLRRERCYLEDRKGPLCRERCYLEDRKGPLCRERCYLEDRKGPLRRERCYLEDRKGPLRRERCYMETRIVRLSAPRAAQDGLEGRRTEFSTNISMTMAQKTLTTSYLAQLSNANHDGVSQQISDRLAGFETDNQMLQQAVQAVGQARQSEDTAFKRYSGKDFAADDLKREDSIEDNYMSATLGILNGLLHLPESEPIYRKAQLARQVFKDFNFRVSDGFEAEARKVINMSQQWQAATEYTLAELGIEAWVQKAVVQANKVLQLVTVRVDNESAKVKGELADARKSTDAAIRKAYDVLNALAVLSPSASLSALISVLLGIEERAKLYYISSGKGSSSGSGGSSDGGSSDGGSSDGGSSDGGSSDGGSGDSGSGDGGGSQDGDGGGSGSGDSGSGGGGNDPVPSGDDTPGADNTGD